MATALNTQFNKFLNYIDKANVIYNRVKDFDIRYTDPSYWKLDKFNNLTNTWCIFYASNENTQLLTTPGIQTFGATSLERLGQTVTVFGVSMTISKSPKIIETNIKGVNGSIYQQYNTGDFDITINFLETGPVFWQQNSKKISALIEILDKPQRLGIINPQLNLVYDVSVVSITGYSIGQDEKFYSHNPISISCKSDKSPDILVPTSNVVAI